MFVPIKPEIPGNPIYGDSDWTSPDLRLLEAFLETKPIDGWYYHPLELPRFSQWELDDIAAIDSQFLTKLILGKFEWGIEQEQLYSIIDSIYERQISQSKSENDWNSHIAITRNISLEFLSRLFNNVKDKPIKDNAISFHNLSSFSNIRRRHTHIGVLSQITSQGVYRILQGSKDVTSILLVPNWDISYDQQIFPFNPSTIGSNTHLVQVDISPQDTHDIIRKLHELNERLFKTKFGVISFDSMNIADILVQTVTPFQFYSELVKQNKIKNGDEIIIWVPSENFSEVLSCMYAKKMWLPIKYIYITVNQNDPIWELLNTGTYSPKVHNSSLFKDIVSEDPIRLLNFERILLHITNNNYQLVKRLLMTLFASQEKVSLGHRNLKVMKQILIVWESMDQDGLIKSNPIIVNTMVPSSNWEQRNTDSQIPFFILNSQYTAHYDFQQDDYLSYIDIRTSVYGEEFEKRIPLEELALRKLGAQERMLCVKEWIRDTLK